MVCTSNLKNLVNKMGFIFLFIGHWGPNQGKQATNSKEFTNGKPGSSFFRFHVYSVMT